MNESKLISIKEKLISYISGNSSPFSKKTEKIIMILAGIILIFGLFATVTGFGTINIFKDIAKELVITFICFIVFFILLIIFIVIHIIKKQVINKVTFYNNIIVINTSSMQGKKLEYDFNLKDYIFTTKKVLRRRSEDSLYFDEHYYLIFTKKDSKRSKEYEIFPNNFDEYYSFIMYIKLFAYNMKLGDLSDIDLNILYKNCNNGKYGLITTSLPNKLLLIFGLVFLTLFLLFSTNIFLDKDLFIDNILVGLIFIIISITLLLSYFKQKKHYSDEVNSLL